jgi:hypothetical protein
MQDEDDLELVREAQMRAGGGGFDDADARQRERERQEGLEARNAKVNRYACAALCMLRLYSASITVSMHSTCVRTQLHQYCSSTAAAS